MYSTLQLEILIFEVRIMMPAFESSFEFDGFLKTQY